MIQHANNAALNNTCDPRELDVFFFNAGKKG